MIANLNLSYVKLSILVLIVLCCKSGFSANDTSRVKVAVKAYRKYLPPSFYIDSIYEVKKIERIDLNKDGSLDKVINWKKEKFQEGDTIYTTIYLREDSSDVYVKTLANLYTLDLSYWSSKSLRDSKLDSLKDLYGASNYGMVEFEKGRIIVGVPTSPSDGCDYYFYFNSLKNDWVLKIVQCWQGWNYLQRELGASQKIENGISIDDFSIPEILGF